MNDEGTFTCAEIEYAFRAWACEINGLNPEGQGVMFAPDLTPNHFLDILALSAHRETEEENPIPHEQAFTLTEIESAFQQWAYQITRPSENGRTVLFAPKMRQRHFLDVLEFTSRTDDTPQDPKKGEDKDR